MDTTIVVKGADVDVNIITQIAQNMDTMGWLLLFLGWALYWLKQLDTARRKDTTSFFSVPLKDFFKSNMIEFPISAIACLIIAILANNIPPELIDLRGRISILLAGYSSSSILSGLLAYRKPLEK